MWEALSSLMKEGQQGSLPKQTAQHTFIDTVLLKDIYCYNHHLLIQVSIHTYVLHINTYLYIYVHIYIFKSFVNGEKNATNAEKCIIYVLA